MRRFLTIAVAFLGGGLMSLASDPPAGPPSVQKKTVPEEPAPPPSAGDAAPSKGRKAGTDDDPFKPGSSPLINVPSGGADAKRELNNRITIRVSIEKVNADSRAITALCLTLGEIGGKLKPLRLEDLSVSEFAKIKINGKEMALADLKPGTAARLELAGRESTLTIVGIEVGEDQRRPGTDDPFGGIGTTTPEDPHKKGTSKSPSKREKTLDNR